ncbi:MAG: ribonuclease P protein subunit [Sulfolobales archaeon]|nr:ribonuclease P protein subunit [Sulfolobales archaeon]MCX8186386.1 ribonuclease P protein subunit [Sulfolobales archaeon]MDW7968879.1 ribonuclease P protein subunit [Sulfolobales archaeon]
MGRNASNIIYHELIGLKARICSHTDVTLNGRSGIIVDETMNTLVLEDGVRTITVPKFGSRIIFKLPYKDVEVRGEMLVGRPEDRIKRLRGVVI